LDASIIVYTKDSVYEHNVIVDALEHNNIVEAKKIAKSTICMERRPTARFAELNGRDAERAATLAYDRFELFPS
jgi:hypothetical protein